MDIAVERLLSRRYVYGRTVVKIDRSPLQLERVAYYASVRRDVTEISTARLWKTVAVRTLDAKKKKSGENDGCVKWHNFVLIYCQR